MKIVRSLVAGLCVLVGVATMSSPASATWLGLDDGTYDVTLTCVFSSVIPCPSTISGTITIAGAGATAFDFVVNGESFVGAPDNGTVTTIFGTDEVSSLQVAPFSFLSLQHFLVGSLPGLSPDSWIYCNTFTPTSCTPATDGNWTAVRVPEPPVMALFSLALGLMALAGVGRRRRA
jgi:hypothetical protein